MDVYEWMKVIHDFGFPIMLTIYLLFKFEKRIESLEEVVKEIVNEVRRL